MNSLSISPTKKVLFYTMTKLEGGVDVDNWEFDELVSVV